METTYENESNAVVVFKIIENNFGASETSFYCYTQSVFVLRKLKYMIYQCLVAQ